VRGSGRAQASGAATGIATHDFRLLRPEPDDRGHRDTDNGTAGAAAGVVWRLRRAARVEPRLAFEVGSNYYFDKVTAAVGNAEVYGGVTLRIASF
jgi:hypothetical protein